MPTTLRRATGDDAAGILACLAEAFAPYRDRYTTGGFDDTVMSPIIINKRLAEMAVFVAIDSAGHVVGTVGYNVPDRHEGHLRGMAVKPDQAGSGVAQQLMNAVEAELRARKCRRITLDTTRPLERAMRFYERNGFKPSGVVRDFFGMELVEYVKELHQL